MNRKRELYYGDNIDVLREFVADKSVDLCYIDPPFNSKRDYSEIYSGIGDTEDTAQVQAFIDTWIWGEEANAEYNNLFGQHTDRFTEQTLRLTQSASRRSTTRHRTDGLSGLHGYSNQRNMAQT